MMDTKRDPFEGAKWMALSDEYLKKSYPDSGTCGGVWICPVMHHLRGHFISGFSIDEMPAEASMEFECFNLFDLYLNDTLLSQEKRSCRIENLLPYLKNGENHLAVRCFQSNQANHFLSGFRGAVRIRYSDGRESIFPTGPDWKCAVHGTFWESFEPENWKTTPEKGDNLACTELPPAAVRRSGFFRKELTLASVPVSAKAVVTAKGFYELHINGCKVKDEWFTPDSSKTMIYQEYSIAEYLHPGKNTIALLSGNGWYNCAQCGFLPIRKPELLLAIHGECSDGSSFSLVSGDDWRTKLSPLLEDDLQYGERYDASLEIPGWDENGMDESDWGFAECPQPQPEHPVLKQDYEPIRRCRTLYPVSVRRYDERNWIFEFAENCSGRIRLKMRNCKAHQQVIIRYFERFNTSGEPVRMVYGDVYYPEDTLPGGNSDMMLRNMDVYFCKGEPEEVYQPRFAYTGFRYVIVEGLNAPPELDDAEFMVLHSDVPQIGSFQCGSRIFSDLNSAVKRTYLSNLFGGPTDCPTREKNFWNGDWQAFAPTACWYTDPSRVIAHWTKYGRKLNSGVYGWRDEVYITPWVLYRYFGDKQILEQQYPAIQELISARGSTLATDNATYRDHHAIQNVSEDFFAPCYQCHMFDIASRIAGVLGKAADAAEYRRIFERLRDEFNAKFFDAEHSDYAPHCQSGILLPLMLDLVPEGKRISAGAVLNRYAVEAGYHATAGFLTIPHLLPLLCDFGYEETAVKIARQTTFPSWGYMLNTGLTTIGESWWGAERCDCDSVNHYAFGGVGRWFFEYLGGIRLDPEIPAFRHFILKPLFRKEESHVKVEYQSKSGKIVSSWLNCNTDSVWLWRFTIPEGTSATVILPGGKPEEYGPGEFRIKVPYPESNS